MAVKGAKKKAVILTPQHISYRKVPATLGGKGRVSLYDARQGLPDLVPDPPGTEPFKKLKWVLVHFPSRRWAAVASKKSALDGLALIHKGENFLSLVPIIEKKQKRKKAESPTSKPPTRGGARASKAPVDAPPETLPAAESEGEEKEEGPPDPEFTPVPDGATFDAAMQLVFPVSRITRNLERLMQATTPIYSKEGDYCGEAPAYQTQQSALKMILEYHQGRATEKEKPPQEKARMSYDELKAWIMGNDAAQEYMQRLLDKAKQAKTTPSAAPPATS